MTTFISSSRRRHLSTALLLACMASASQAQTAPAAAAPVAAPVSSAPAIGAVRAENGRSPEVGATARHLLEAQASGRIAAPAHPMSGATASASLKRYVDTFAHPIPEFFESRVGKKTSE